MPETETEIRIKEAARTVFLQKGYAGARMQHIADLAGINKALLHYYYRSKEKLYDVIFMEVLEELVQGLKEAFVEEVRIEEKIDIFIDHYISTLMKNSHMPLFIVSEISRDPDAFVAKMQSKSHFSEAGILIRSFISDLNDKYGDRMNAIHLLLNIVSMSVFPFVAKPMLGVITEMDEPTWKILMESRKEEVKIFVRNALKEQE